ncbi:unnamed protein product [Psylliodes chrysocephalus]|uniref:Uncharacterized protein n=1 Tax=Psylliodes chrysocephalus TaxID=3402493 RepID=A0A9P0CFD1_9CUCU|nr:unnamed protein product [Psylliodes chrysocephala]
MKSESTNLEEAEEDEETCTKRKRLTEVITKKKNKSKKVKEQDIITKEKETDNNIINLATVKEIANTNFVDEVEFNNQTSTASDEGEINYIEKDGRRKPKRLNQRNTAKQLRAEGKQYCSSKKKIVPARSLKLVPCKSCQNNCTAKFSEEDRQGIFDHFWKLGNTQEQNSFLLSCVSIQNIKRKYTKKNESRRTLTKIYTMQKNNTGEKVCRQFLLSTLCINEKRMRRLCTNKTAIGTPKKDMRGKNTKAKNKTKEETREHVMNYIKMLPAIPSHYCRSSSSKKYLPAEFKNIKRLYRLYKTWTHDNNYNFVSESVFRKIFTVDFNIGFHAPRKDKCNTYIRYNKEKASNEEKEKYKAHIDEKEEAKKLYHADQKKSNLDGFLCSSFDMQKGYDSPDNLNSLATSNGLVVSDSSSTYNSNYFEMVANNLKLGGEF